MGLRKNSRANASAATVFWHREDRNRVKLTEASRLANPAAATASCSCPIVMALRLTVEKTSCMELFKKSQPKKLLERIRCRAMHRAKETAVISTAAASLITASFPFPYLAQRRISSACV